MRKTPMKAAKSMKSKTVATLYPGQVVELLRRDGKWIEVEFYDYLVGETRSGWVAKKYFKMVRQ